MATTTSLAEHREVQATLRNADVQPLAMIEFEGFRDYRQSKAIAVSWAKSHPDEDGYIVISEDPESVGFVVGAVAFRVTGGKAREISWGDADPGIKRHHDAFNARVDARESARRARLRHPQCPGCYCRKEPS